MGSQRRHPNPHYDHWPVKADLVIEMHDHALMHLGLEERPHPRSMGRPLGGQIAAPPSGQRRSPR